MRKRAAAALLAVAFSALPAWASISSAERDALIALYERTTGTSWTRSDGWRGAAGSECSWFGVTCNEAQTSVTAINLSKNNLGGALPSQIGQLINLQSLDLSNNHIGGPIPPEISGLTSLVSLDLWGNVLTGAVIPEITALTTLRHLDLDTNALSGPVPVALRQLRNLEYLDLGANKLTGTIPKELSELTHLQVFALYENQLEGAIPPELWTMTSLTQIWLSANRFTGSIPREVANLVNLEYLVAWSNALSGPLPVELTTLRKLVAISLTDNHLSGPIPPQIGQLSELRYLYLDGNELTGAIPDSIRSLQKLEEFDLSSNNLSGDLPPWLPELKKLTILGLGGDKLTGSIPNAIGDLQQLTYLDLGANDLQGSVPSSLWSLSKLRRLDLGSTSLSGSLSPAIGNLVNLEFLDLSLTRLSGSIPLEIGNLKKLSFLTMQIAEFSGPLPDSIGQLPLEYVFLGRNELTGVVPPGLWKSTRLKTLYLNHNHFEGSLPEEIGDLVDLEALELSENRFSGQLPASIGNLVKLRTLDLNRNVFRGVIPHEITRLTALPDGFGLDIAENALTIDDPAVRTFVLTKDGSAEEFPTQTLTPANVRVTATTDRTATVAWDKVAYWWAKGGIQITARTTSNGPIVGITTTQFSSDTSGLIRNLSPETLYYFTVTAVTEPYFGQQNLLLSDPSPAVPATTGTRVLGPPQVEETESPRGLVQVDSVPQNEDRVILTNFGDKPTAITMDLHADFATIEPAAFTLDPGASRTITIKSVPKPAGTYSGYALALGEGAQNYIWITLLSVGKPSGTAIAEAVDSRIELAGAPGSDSVGQARFRNIGTTELVGMLVSDQPWLVPDVFRVFISPQFVSAVNFRVIRARRPPGVEGALTANLSLIYVANPFGSKGKLTPTGDTSGISVTKVTVVDVSKPAVSGSIIPPAGSDIALFLPGVASFQKNGTSFVSDVSVLNDSGLQALGDVRLYYTPASGSNTTLATLAAIPSANSVTLANIVSNVYGVSSGVGSIQIRSDHWQSLVIHSKLLGLSEGGSVAAGIPTFRSDRSIASGQELYLVGVRKSQGVQTNLYVQETSGSAANATITFVDPDGKAVGESRSVAVSAFGMIELNDAAPERAATAIVTNQGPGRIAAYGRVFGDNGENWTVVDWSRSQNFDLGARMRIPYVVTTQGTSGGRRRAVPHAATPASTTELLVFNPSTEEVGVTVQVRGADGAVSDKRMTVLPRRTLTLTNVGADAGTGTAQAIITPIHEGKLIATARVARGAAGMTIPVISSASGLRSGRSAIFSGLEDSTSATVASAAPGTYRTSFGVLETGGASVVVRARIVLDEGRSLAGSSIYRDFTLGPGQQVILDEVVRGIVGASRDSALGDLHNLQLRIDVVSGAGAVVPFVMITDNATGDSLFRLE